MSSLAHESFEVESDTALTKKVRKAYAPYAKTLEVVRRATLGSPEIVSENFGFDRFFHIRLQKVLLCEYKASEIDNAQREGTVPPKGLDIAQGSMKSAPI